MKRLAIGVVVVGVLGLIGTAEAEPSAQSRGSNDVCRHQAENVVRTGIEDFLYLEGGNDLRKPAPGVVLCYAAPGLSYGDTMVAGTFSAWVDPRHGRVGYSCAKRKGWVGADCKYDSVTVDDVRGTTPVDNPQGPWALHLFGIDVEYAFGASAANASVDPGQRCHDDRCVGADRVTAESRNGLGYRAGGWQCAGDGACSRSSGPAAVTVGEQDEAPTLAAGGIALDVPAVCVEASTDVSC